MTEVTKQQQPHPQEEQDLPCSSGPWGVSHVTEQVISPLSGLCWGNGGGLGVQGGEESWFHSGTW